MSSTHVGLYYHLIFSTKNRYRWIKESWESRLHSYLGGILREIDAVALEVGGVEDHVHILASLKATHCVAKVLGEIKSNSSGWIHSEIGARLFEWQDGYAAFTVGKSQIAPVRQYIRRQREHHRKKTFQEEYRELLQASGIEIDEKYLW